MELTTNSRKEKMDNYKAASERSDEAERLLVPPFKRVATHTAEQTIWSEGAEHSTEPLLICAPSFEDIQRMAGYPVDEEGYAVTGPSVESDEDYGNRMSGLHAEEGGDQ